MCHRVNFFIRGSERLGIVGVVAVFTKGRLIGSESPEILAISRSAEPEGLADPVLMPGGWPKVFHI